MLKSYFEFFLLIFCVADAFVFLRKYFNLEVLLKTYLKKIIGFFEYSCYLIFKVRFDRPLHKHQRYIFRHNIMLPSLGLLLPAFFGRAY